MTDLEHLAAAIEAGKFDRKDGPKGYTDLWDAVGEAGLSVAKQREIIKAHYDGQAAAIVRALIAKEGKE